MLRVCTLSSWADRGIATCVVKDPFLPYRYTTVRGLMKEKVQRLYPAACEDRLLCIFMTTLWWYQSLISGVANDLDLMLQDLFPDAIPSPLRDEYGFADDIPLDQRAFANHGALLEQYMRGTGPEPFPVEPLPPGSSTEYRSSRSLHLPPAEDTATSDSGRTTPTSASPSPPPPAPPPRCPVAPSVAAQAHLSSAAASILGAQQPGMVSSSSVSSVQECTSEEDGGSSGSFAPCDIGLLERLIRTHPIWFLPGIGRAGATHLLQGKDVGNFVVRHSSKPSTMALSVRLPEEKGPYVEHYLIETVGDAQLRLEGSDNNFHAIPMLVAHYCQCCDELPVQLALPLSLAQAGSRQELSSLALLGQEFWLSSLIRSPVPGSEPAPAEPTPALHSTFKPSSQEDPNTPSSSSPPPPVAPKHQPHGAPPPPPPRSALPTPRAPQSPPTDASSPELSSPPSSNRLTEEKDSEDVPDPSPSPESKQRKPAQVAHYSQSNISDLPYYTSSLSDKISDYEDVWGLDGTERRVSRLQTFRPHSKSENQTSQIFSQRHQSRQSDSFTQTANGESPSPESSDNFPSPFYSEPVDSVPPARIFSHRFSDPNLHWPPSAHRRGVDATLDEERLASLSSSVDNIRALSPEQSRRQPLSTQWVQELSQRISSKKDSQTQVSSRDLSSVPKKPPPVPRKGGKGGGAWPLDSSWEWMAHDDDTSSDDAPPPPVPSGGMVGSAKFPLHVG
ncbi:hypothetical protein JTE90_006883 [Oedothorax gibbosus]|uniref:SH2 domain-containing protein n=1 Tax=Oedothorax gibbosus TaxID=931172 RepID=A0AAV6VNS0_9ARAC|nr:hypothetical protein JTE90_006883 [Oedothorax gibbosus]